MPIGVPKVPFLIPVLVPEEKEKEEEKKEEEKKEEEKKEEEKKEEEKKKEEKKEKKKQKKVVIWVDLYNRLYRQRVLFLGQEIDTVISNQLVGLIAFLSIENKKKDIFLYINCPGGWILPGFGLFDMIQGANPDINTICLGLAASLGSFMLLGGTPPKRLALEYAKIMMHQPMGVFRRSQTDEVLLELSLLLDARKTIARTYVQKTGQPLWAVSRDLERDSFMTPEEAQKYGIVDAVVDENTVLDLDWDLLSYFEDSDEKIERDPRPLGF
uniref:Clp protease proteolytic subunit n=1 Tax=Semiaquilegia danxiashanensis TaxID=2678244 RepID=UPI00315D829B